MNDILFSILTMKIFLLSSDVLAKTKTSHKFRSIAAMTPPDRSSTFKWSPEHILQVDHISKRLDFFGLKLLNL